MDTAAHPPTWLTGGRREGTTKIPHRDTFPAMTDDEMVAKLRTACEGKNEDLIVERNKLRKALEDIGLMAVFEDTTDMRMVKELVRKALS